MPRENNQKTSPSSLGRNRILSRTRGRSMSRRMLADFDRDVGCCSCFGFLRKSDKEVDYFLDDQFSQECMQNGGFVANGFLQDYQKVLHFPGKNRAICRENPVKETTRLVQSEDANGHKMVNEYVRVRTIGRGSYGKVVLYQSTIDGKQYAIKAFYKSRLCKVRVSSSETALTDVRREASILKTLQHPNIVNLVEVIDDPDSDHFYIVLDYVDGKWVCDASGTQGGIGEDTSRRYLRDIISGLMYLHAHDVVHGDIKPENLLVTRTGIVKICDFGISHAFEDGNDVLRRSPGTPVFTAPECCFGSSYHGKAADVWAVGVTLYCMIFGYCPFIGDCLQDTYDKIVNSPLSLPQEMNSELSDLLEGLLCKDPSHRMTLSTASEHPWVTRELGRIPKITCKCKSSSSIQKGSSLGPEAEIVYYSKHS